MPVKKNSAIAPDSDPSVFDSTGEQMLRRLIDLFGGDNEIPMPDPMAAPLVSVFRNKLLREKGTQVAIDRARALDPRIGQHFEEFAQKYPRVAAHMNTVRGDPGGPPMAAEIKSGVQRPRIVTVNPETFDRDPRHIISGIAHEGTHVAQALGNKHTSTLYKAADELAGYHGNPFERSAFSAGSRATQSPEYMRAMEDQFGVGPDHPPVMRALVDLLEKNAELDPSSPRNQELRQRVMDIIKSRLGGQP